MNPDESTLVLGYIHPDLDAYGCSLAYAELLSRENVSVRAGKSGEPIGEVHFLNKFLQAPLLPTYDPADFARIVVVDTNRPSNLDTRVDPSKVVEVVDHRPGRNIEDFPGARWQIEMVGAAATLIGEKFQQQGVQPSQLSAAFMLAAIISNTLNFKGTVTTERDRQMAEWLGHYALLPNDFATMLFRAKSDLGGDKLNKQLIGDFAQMDEVNGVRVGLGQLELVGGKELLAERELDILVILRQLSRERHLDHIFTTLVDVDAGETYFVAEASETKELLSNALELRFEEDVAVMDRLILRKEFFMDLKRVLGG